MTSHDSAPTTGSSPTTHDRSRPTYWRSVAELESSPEFNQYLDREFPVAASEFPEGVSRRRWMQLMGASLAVAGATGCRYPEEVIAPFVLRPEGRVPGETYSRATNFELADRVYNLLIECVDGRPIKVQPNPEHPSGGGTDVYSQASILGLYDPDRSRSDSGFLLRRSAEGRRRAVGWEAFEGFGAARIAEAESSNRGASFAVLMPPTASPSMVRMIKKLRERLPNASVCRFDAARSDEMRQATTEVFGKPAKQRLHLEEAEVIVSLQADFLGNDHGMIHNAAAFAKTRDPMAGTMSRLYVVEGGFSSTGAVADSRLALQPSQIPAFLSELARRVEKLSAGETHDHGDESTPFDELSHADRLERFLDVLSHDVAEAGDKAVVIVGDALGADVVAAGIHLNNQLGSLGTIQRFMPVVDGDLGKTVSLSELTKKINEGDIETLLILDVNVVHAAPGEIDFATALGKLDHSIYLGQYDDETAAVCEWSLPQSHVLESWGDCVNDDGVYGVCQPQILPLLGGRSSIEVLAVMLGESETQGDAIVRRTADSVGSGSLSDRQWRTLLHDGFLEDLVVQADPVSSDGDAKSLSDEAPRAIEASGIDRDAFEVIFTPAEGIYDGRFANNGWLQELPQSLTKVTWDNAAIMSPSTAESLGVKHGLMVALTRNDRTVTLPVYEMPGCAPAVVTVAFGYGRTRVGAVGGSSADGIESVGTDVSPLRTSDSFSIAYGVQARPRFDKYKLSTTQDHWAIDERGRDEAEERSFTLIREGTVALMEKVPEFAEAKGPHVPQIGTGSPWKEPMERIMEERPELPQWGMAIDLNKCIGCNACVVACQSENNVPIVGKEQVANSREMHWLRIDRYFQGDKENANIVQQPVACMHCETAPCEQVCPVAATVHTDEGLNAMAYNRCIGTRYCANNCPFKVRRFNYFNYNKDIGVGYGIDAYPNSIENANRKLQALVLNPEVTVRGRGVMEKCTYCVQRIEKAKINARVEGGRPIADGEIVTACQSACPTRAIEFGNVSDPNSVVAKKHADKRSYGMLGQLNVKPRTEYLARVTNPHPRLMTSFQLEQLATLEAPHHGHGHDGHGHDDHGHDDHGHGDHGHQADEHARNPGSRNPGRGAASTT